MKKLKQRRSSNRMRKRKTLSKNPGTRKHGKIYRLVYIGCACTDKENTTVCLTPEELKKEIDEYGKDHPYMIKDYERYLEGQKSE